MADQTYEFQESTPNQTFGQSVYKACRISLDVIAIFVLLVCVILCGCGLFTSAWQIGDLFELGEYHEYGLWEDCIKGWTRTAGPKNEFICFYKPIFGNQWQYNFQRLDNDDAYSAYYSQLQQRQSLDDMNQSWRLATLAFMCIFFGLSLFALFFGCAGLVYKCPAIAWASLTCVSTLCGLIAVVTFAVNCTYPQNRFVLMTLSTAELTLGRSFYFALAATITGIIASILSVCCVVLLMLQNTEYLVGRSHRAKHARQYVYHTNVKQNAPRSQQPFLMHDGFPMQTGV